MNLVMMGTGTFAEPTIEALLKAFPGEVVGLVTQPERQIGRRTGASRQTGVGMATIAKAHSIPVIQPESINSEEGLTQLAALNPDLLVVAAYGQILKPSVLAIPKLGAINVHASLLPKYRGAAPVAHAILNGETETGVTIIRITPGLDAGEMLAQEKLSILDDETTGLLEERLSIIGARIAIRVVEKMKAGAVAGTQQDSALVTKAPKITKEQGLIYWKKPAESIVNHIRAMQPWPTAYTYLHRPGKNVIRIAIHKALCLGWKTYGWTDDHGSIGDCGICDEFPKEGEVIGVVAGDQPVFIAELQPAGKKLMNAAEFVRGNPIPPGSRFGPEQL